ncbi:hypothetical protein VTL71DRAFT_14459 [Oculimacula yallundae]|uniref:Uncharacterized protein n=1 Tax=Oculimacula yallundae TaxID=86028 RepID=A0ABR4CIH7_9HELO
MPYSTAYAKALRPRESAYT